MIKTILHLDDKKYNVLEWFYSFIQNSDTNGRPSNKPRLTKVSILIEAKDVVEFLLWANHPTMQKQLMLQILPIIFGTKSRKIYLIDCHCVGYLEEFNSTSTTPQTIRLELTCGGFEEDNTVHSTTWRKTYPNTGTATTINRNEEDEEEQKIVRQYITDRNDVELNEYEMGDKIFYVVESQNMEGETIDVKLNEKEVDFLYKDKRLKDDTISSFTIGSEIEKIPLQVINEEYNKLD